MLFYVVLAVLLFLYKECVNKEFKVLEHIMRYFIYWLGVIYCGLWIWEIALEKSVGEAEVIFIYFILPLIWLFYLITEYGIVGVFKRKVLKDEKALPALGGVILLQMVSICVYFCLILL